MKIIAIVLALAACSHAKSNSGSSQGFSDDLPPREDLSSQDDQASKYEAEALTTFKDPDGYEVGIGQDDSPQGVGDAAWRTGLTMISLSCDDGAPLLATLVKGIKDAGGMIPRHDPQVSPENSTRDQVTAVALAFVDRWQRCPADQATIAAAWAQHVSYVQANGRLGPDSNGDMLTFAWLWGAVGQYFGVAGTGGGSKQEWEAGLPATADGVKAAHAVNGIDPKSGLSDACYPVHIGTLQLVLAVKIGQPASRSARSSVCSATASLGLPLTDWYCERSHALAYLQAFKPNVWQLQSQRCPAWESPDAGTATWPSLGFLEAYALAR